MIMEFTGRKDHSGLIRWKLILMKLMKEMEEDRAADEVGF